MAKHVVVLHREHGNIRAAEVTPLAAAQMIPVLREKGSGPLIYFVDESAILLKNHGCSLAGGREKRKSPPCPGGREGLGYGVTVGTISPRKTTAILVFLLTIPVVAGAQDIDIRLRHRYGFDGLVKPGSWNPLYVGLTNLGDDIQGALTVESMVSPGNNQEGTTLLLTEELTLRRGESIARRYVVPLARGGLPLRLRLRDGETLLYEEEVRPPLLAPPQQLIVGLGELSGLSLGRNAAETAYPLMEHLPERWLGYLPADIVVIADPPMERLTPKQLSALTEWLRRGGRALLLTGDGASPEVRAYLSQLWSEGLDEKSTEAARMRRFGGGILARPTDGATSLPEAISAMEPFATPVSPPPLESRRLPFADPTAAAVIDSLVYHYPSRWIIGLLLLLAVAALALLTRPELPWPPLRVGGPLLLPLFFSLLLGALFGGPLSPPKDLAVEFGRYKPREGGLFVVENDLLLMSSRERPYRVALSEEELLLPAAGRRERLYRTAEGVLAGELTSWDHRFFTTWEREPLSFSASITEGELIITNGEPFALFESFLITDRSTYRLGPVSPGQRRSWELSSLEGRKASETAFRQSRELQREQSVRMHLQEGSLFVGWLRPASGMFELQPDFAASEVVGVITVELPEGVPE